MSYGNTYGREGIQVTYPRRQADNLGTTSYVINDLFDQGASATQRAI